MRICGWQPDVDMGFGGRKEPKSKGLIYAASFRVSSLELKDSVCSFTL